MASIPKIEPSELITKYQLHPEIIDIFVEGEFDKDFLINHFESTGKLVDATVLPIDCVNIKAPSSNSNKEAVITLATFIDEKFINATIKSIFIVDADCERLNETTRSSKSLHYTDFTCMEMYFCNSPTLKKFLNFTCNLNSEEEAAFMNTAELILPSLFVARSVNELHTLGILIPDFSAGLKKKGDLNSFETQKYLMNFLSLIKNPTKKIKSENSFQENFEKLPHDLRHKAHGHDFIYLLFEFLWKRSSLKLINKGEDVLRFGGRILGSSLNTNEFSSTNLFHLLHGSHAKSG